MNSLDKFDQAILAALQDDGALSIAALSERIGLSTTPCWKRVKRLEMEREILKKATAFFAKENE